MPDLPHLRRQRSSSRPSAPPRGAASGLHGASPVSAAVAAAQATPLWGHRRTSASLITISGDAAAGCGDGCGYLAVLCREAPASSPPVVVVQSAMCLNEGTERWPACAIVGGGTSRWVMSPCVAWRSRDGISVHVTHAGSFQRPVTDSASMAAAMDVGALLSSGPADLGLSPLLAGLWGDHTAALPHWFAQEPQLRAHYFECAERRPAPEMSRLLHIVVVLESC